VGLSWSEWEAAMSVPLPTERTAEFHVLFTGYVGRGTASTVGFVRDGATLAIVDPGMAPSHAAILDPLAALGVGPQEITDVIFSHHHPDHTLNAALFPAARFHDHWAIYQGDRWDSRPAEGYALSPSIRLIATPGHTPQDITTLIGTPAGIIACTHLWWSAAGPAEDPLADDPAALHRGRERVLGIGELRLIVPGHGAPFPPTPDTPR
jgi:glyoxylase-like metal-dependent hydrolase (beta-lactamase superfamily II)